MDWLLIFVLVAIVGQFALIKWSAFRQAKIAVDVKKARADLLESAADQQAVCKKSHSDSLVFPTHGAADDSN